MNFRTALLFSSAIIGRTLAYAQDIPDSLNLVENGSFELLDGKLKKLGGIGIAQGWKSPTGKNADLYSETITGPASAPKNDHGEQSALNGQNYAGLMWWSYLNKEPRTYIQSKLKHSLKKGSRYCVRFYTTLGDLSKYGSDQLGVY